MFKDLDIPYFPNWKERISKANLKRDISSHILDNIYLQTCSKNSLEQVNKSAGTNFKEKIDSGNVDDVENKVAILLQKLKEKKDAYVSLHDVVNNYEQKLSKVSRTELRTFRRSISRTSILAIFRLIT